MIRILIFILGGLFIAGAVTILAGLDGRIIAEAAGRRFDIHAGFAVGALIVLVGAAAWLAGALKDLRRLPGTVRSIGAEGRREKGLLALTRGFEAVAIGDGRAALKQARIAERQLDAAGVTRLLAAQAAQLAGDREAAQSAFAAMLAAPESEFLGLSGLFAEAERAGDAARARDLAERAFRLRPGAPWAFGAVFGAALDRGAWREARDILAAGARAGAVDGVRAARAEAALLAADAHASAAAGEVRTALEEARRALKIAPGFAPAATLAARLLDADGKKAKALRTLARAYEAAPHVAIIDVYGALLSGAEGQKRGAALDDLAARAPDAPASIYSRAAARLALRDHAGVAAVLEPVLKARATARACALMAEAAAAANSSVSDQSARDWLKRAAAAPRDFEPAGESGFDLARPGWARLIREYMDHARLAPPALETSDRGVPEEVLKRLVLRAGEAAPAEAGSAVAASEGRAPPANESESAPPRHPPLAGDAVSAARAIAAAGEVS